MVQTRKQVKPKQTLTRQEQRQLEEQLSWHAEQVWNRERNRHKWLQVFNAVMVGMIR